MEEVPILENPMKLKTKRSPSKRIFKSDLESSQLIQPLPVLRNSVPDVASIIKDDDIRISIPIVRTSIAKEESSFRTSIEDNRIINLNNSSNDDNAVNVSLAQGDIIAALTNNEVPNATAATNQDIVSNKNMTKDKVSSIIMASINQNELVNKMASDDYSITMHEVSPKRAEVSDTRASIIKDEVPTIIPSITQTDVSNIQASIIKDEVPTIIPPTTQTNVSNIQASIVEDEVPAIIPSITQNENFNARSRFLTEDFQNISLSNNKDNESNMRTSLVKDNDVVEFVRSTVDITQAVANGNSHTVVQSKGENHSMQSLTGNISLNDTSTEANPLPVHIEKVLELQAKLEKLQPYRKPNFNNLLNSKGSDHTILPNDLQMDDIELLSIPHVVPQVVSTSMIAPGTPDGNEYSNKRLSKKANTKSRKDSLTITSSSCSNLSELELLHASDTPASGYNRKIANSNSDANSHTKRRSHHHKRSIIDLPIKIRPTEPIRSGYLLKFDSQAAHATGEVIEEDLWMTQFVSLDIATGLFVHYAEINGKKIARGKFDMHICQIKPLDTVFHGRSHVFKLYYKVEKELTHNNSMNNMEEIDITTQNTTISTKKVAIYFAAEDEEILNYWLISFDDVNTYYEESKLKAPTPPPIIEVTSTETLMSNNAMSNTLKQTTIEEPSSILTSKINTTNNIHAENNNQNIIPPPVIITNPRDVLIQKLKISINRITYPAQRLARRVKIWYSSSGFSLSSEEEINGFINELKQSNDSVLMSFAEEKFKGINDWANLLELLRKYESKIAIDQRNKAIGNDIEDQITFEMNATIPQLEIQSTSSITDENTTNALLNDNNNSSNKIVDFNSNSTTSTTTNSNTTATTTYSNNSVINTINSSKEIKTALSFQLKEDVDINKLASILSQEFDLTESIIANELPQLFHGPGKILNIGLTLLRDDLTFAEDLMLYQEEVIDNLWQNYTSLKHTCEQKDETINQLYYRLSSIHHNSTTTHSTPNKSINNNSNNTNNRNNHVNEIDFNNDNARLSSVKSPEESITFMNMNHQSWMEEKKIMILTHNETKQRLNNEILTLRKALSPENQKVLIDQKQYQQINAKLEEELVNTHIATDNLKAEIGILNKKLSDSESEKVAIEAHYQEHLTKLVEQYEQGMALYKEKLKAKYAKQANEIIQKNKVQIQHVSSSNSSTIKPINNISSSTMTSMYEPVHSVNSLDNTQSTTNNTSDSIHPTDNQPTLVTTNPIQLTKLPLKSNHSQSEVSGLYDAYNYSVELKDEIMTPEDISRRWINRYLENTTGSSSIVNENTHNDYTKRMLIEPQEVNDISLITVQKHNQSHSGKDSNDGIHIKSIPNRNRSHSYNNNHNNSNNNNNNNNNNNDDRSLQLNSDHDQYGTYISHAHTYQTIHPTSSPSSSSSSYTPYDHQLKVSRSAVSFSSPLRQALKKDIKSGVTINNLGPATTFNGSMNTKQHSIISNNNSNNSHNNTDLNTNKHFMSDTTSRKQKVTEGRDPAITNITYLGKQRNTGAWKFTS